MKVNKLIEELKRFPDDFEVFVSMDSEGNGFSTTSETSIEWSRQDKAIIIYPWSEGLQYEDIMPKQSMMFDEELSQGRIGNVIKGVQDGNE